VKVKKVKAIIEKGSNSGYGIYLPDVPGYIGLGDTEDDAKQDLRDAINEVVFYCKEEGIPNNIYGGNIEFDYRYDLSGFFKRFEIFNVSALAKAVGINSGLMRQYKAGKTYISGKRKQQIENGIHQLAENMLSIRF
jgi:predicted RNase H-like HicB family nuclease